MMASTYTTTFTIENIQQALTGPLPGIEGQIKMAPSPVDGRVDRWQVPDNCRDAGVLLLLYPYASNGADQDLHLVLTRRHEYIGVHSGQISLPGGRRETGEPLQKTALRETKEEIGVVPEALEVVGQLSSLYTPPSNFCIYPFVGYSDSRPAFRSDPREVAELIEVPFSLFADPTTCKAETWYFEKYGSRQVPFFEVFGHKIWGATAMILSELLTLMLNYQTQT
jgi:8-oxo-dGTP pyrophosphatase MutT (NUDIX family)